MELLPLIGECTGGLHELLDILIPGLIEFFLFVGFLLLHIIILPHLAAIVMVTNTLIINNEIVVPSALLSAFILLIVNLLENMSFLFDLQNISVKDRLRYLPHTSQCA